MTLRSICSEICKEFKDSLENNFPKDLSNDEIFAFANNICESKLKCINFKVREKCKVKSEESRKIGNEKFSKNLKWDALQHYNESMALAPVESEELAFAYGNRATCLLSLGFPQEALKDIATALSLKISQEYKNKLLSRKKKCMNLENKKNEWFFGSGEAVSLPNSKTSVFDCGSDSIDLLEDKYYERQIVAKNDIKTGQVLIVEKPFSSILLPQFWYTHCSYCFVRNLNLVPCPDCSEAMFCDDKCRTNAFKKFHKTECPFLFALKELKAERMELLALRILIQASNQGEDLEKLYLETEENNLKNNSTESIKPYKSLDFYNIYNLVTNKSKRTLTDLFYRSVVSVALIVVLEKFTEFFNKNPEEKRSQLKIFSGGLILRFKQSLPCNAHEISEFCQDGLNEIGSGAYATLSLINHSCDPNVVRHSFKDNVVLRAIKPIKKGEQIFDNYGYHYATHKYEERQKALMSQYYFKCNCEPCSKLWPTFEDLPNENVETLKEMDLKLYKKLTESFEKNLMSMIDGNFNAEMIEECMKYLDFLDEYVKKPWMNFNNCQEAIKHCLSFKGNHFRLSKGVNP